MEFNSEPISHRHNDSCLKIMNKSLEFIADWTSNKQIRLIGANESKIYCIDELGKLLMFDWSLNKPLIGFSFQDASSTEPFYVKCVALHSNFPSIIQLEHIENQYFVVNSLENLMYIFDQEGKTIKKIQIEADNTVIKLNSKNHLVWCIVFEKSLKLYNKYGEL